MCLIFRCDCCGMPILDCVLFDGCYYCHRDEPGDLTESEENYETLQDVKEKK